MMLRLALFACLLCLAPLTLAKGPPIYGVPKIVAECPQDTLEKVVQLNLLNDGWFYSYSDKYVMVFYRNYQRITEPYQKVYIATVADGSKSHVFINLTSMTMMTNVHRIDNEYPSYLTKEQYDHWNLFLQTVKSECETRAQSLPLQN